MMHIDRRQLEEQKERAAVALKSFYEFDMRWSFLVAGGLIVVGIAINLIFTHGWIIWPFLAIAGLMSMIHEAAERNGQGVPPLYAYGFLVGAIVLWMLVTLIFSVVNPHVLLLGVVALGYQCLRAFLHDRERNRIVEARRAGGCCIFCGERVDAKIGMCTNCGNEPDPHGARLARVASIVVGRKNPAHVRAALKPESHAGSAKKKEEALLARHRARTRPKR
jgi:hypothetical protein